MHSIQNISERNKIDTQSRADAYIRRKRLISKSILETEKTLKTLSSGKMYKKTKKKQKNQKKNKRTQKT